MSDRDIARYLSRIRHQQQTVPAIILHFDPTARDLWAWFWYVDTVHEHRHSTERRQLEGLLRNKEHV